MSIQAIAQVLDLELADSSAKFVLVGLANHTSLEGQCFPSVKTLMRYTGLSESAVRASIKRLEEAGLLRVVRRKNPDNPRQNLTSLYYLSLSAPSAAAAGGGPAETPPSPSSETTPGPAEEGRTVIKNHNLTASDAREGLADDWRPLPVLMEQIQSLYPTIDCEDQLRAFILKSQANGTVHRDPTAAFKSWMHQSRNLKLPPRARTTTPAPAVAEGPDAVATRLENFSEKRFHDEDQRSEAALGAAKIWLTLDPGRASRCAQRAREIARPGSWHEEQALAFIAEHEEGIATWLSTNSTSAPTSGGSSDT